MNYVNGYRVVDGELTRKEFFEIDEELNILFNEI